MHDVCYIGDYAYMWVNEHSSSFSHLFNYVQQMFHKNAPPRRAVRVILAADALKIPRIGYENTAI